MKGIILGTLLSISLPIFAANVAVIDSGTDFTHNWLKDRDWVNVNETPGDMIDNDQNGKVDDLNGWNFADNNGVVFNRNHLSGTDADTYRFFEVLERVRLNRATPSDQQYWKEHVTSLTPDQKKALSDKVNYYGEMFHSTHVSGIIVTQNPDAIILSARMFPDKEPPTASQLKGKSRNFIYDLFAQQFNKTFVDISTYINDAKMDVTNMSIGTATKLVATKLLKIINSNPTEAQITQATMELEASFEKSGKTWVDQSKDILFVIAAGNDSNDNDIIPYYPANLKAENTITVAASNGYQSLAGFSNYGKTTVQVAAPGVALVSSVPSYNLDQTIPMSGTSMAAPFVTGVASKIKDINFRLSPLEIRAILMGTVDKKAWLADKVVSGGIVNPERAYKAADYVKKMSLQNAISRSLAEVGDKPELPTSYGVENRRISLPQEDIDFANHFVF